jgi:hypothetical protein
MASCLCGNPTREGQRNCRECRNGSMRANRPSYSELSPAEKRKSNARSKLNTYVRRGKIVRAEFCERCCSTGRIEGHHHLGYDFPLAVRWLCRGCHRGQHLALGGG